ncbi:hypothetical protein [Paenibacillus sp. 1P07SE]|uniref:hypothetical protein n=1 Tax=Paenibacillus sp. 1P07SE TaxID=3132209 RepID=UPI0039A6D66D
MKLAEMLGYADIEQLNRIAEQYRLQCNSHSKNELIQTILSTISRREAVKQQLNELTIAERRFLGTLLFDTQYAYSLEELIARVQQGRFDQEQKSAAIADRKHQPPGGKSRKTRSKKIDPPQPAGPRSTIVKFKEAGWLFNGFSGSSRYLLHVPTDLRDRFREQMALTMREQLQYIEEPDGFRDEQQLLAEDVLTLLRYIRQHEPAITAEGYMYKRSILQVLESMHILEEPPGRGAWRFGYGKRMKEYPNRMSLIYDYGYYDQLFKEESGRLVIAPSGTRMLEERMLPEPTELYRFWLRLYKGAIPNILTLANWIHVLADPWVTTASLASQLLPYIKPFYYDNASDVLETRILAMMMHMGLLRIGEHHRHGGRANDQDRPCRRVRRVCRREGSYRVGNARVNR